MSDNFEWNEDLIKEMLYSKMVIPNHYVANVQRCLDEFKKSKEIDLPKDWEILSFFDTYKNVVHWQGQGQHFGATYDEWVKGALNNKYPIHSVKRLSDGEVFTVGENVNTVGYAGYPNKAIKRFFIGSYNVMYIQWDENKGSNDGCMSINAIEKVKPKVPLFTIEGLNIFEGDEYFEVNLYSYEITKEIARRFFGIGSADCKYFFN